MRSRVTFTIAAAVFMAPLLAGSLTAQQQAAPAAPAQQQPQAGRGGRNGGQDGAAPGRQGGQGRGQTIGGVGRGRAAGPPRPAPRNAQGRVLLGTATPKEKGVWIGGGLGRRDEATMQPWARALEDSPDAHEQVPHNRSCAAGVSRPFLTPYGVEFVELPEMQRIYIFDIGGPHTWRTIYMDGRKHPANLSPSYYGHSIGWWEGDTLVVDSRGFNESFWLDRGASPHTEQMHTIERFTRTDSNAMRYELTVDDPGAYTQPWTATMNLRWENGTELFEYICQQQNYAHELMVGQHQRVDRTTVTVP